VLLRATWSPYDPHYYQVRTGPPSNLAFARWAGWSTGQMGRHVKC